MEWSGITKTILINNNMLGRLTQPNDKAYYISSYSNQGSVLLVERDRQKSVEQNGKPINKSPQICPTEFWQRGKNQFNIRRVAFPTKAIGQLQEKKTLNSI